MHRCDRSPKRSPISPAPQGCKYGPPLAEHTVVGAEADVPLDAGRIGKLHDRLRKHGARPRRAKEAFSKLLPGSLKGIDTPIAYLRRIVRNLAINRRRRHRYELEQATEHARQWIQPLRMPNPEQSALFNDQIRIIASVLAAFPRQTRAIVEMHCFDGYTLEEIATRLDLSVTTVHRILSAAMADMTKLLSDRLK